MNENISGLNAAAWRKLEALAQAHEKAASELSHGLLTAALECAESDPELTAKLVAQAKQVDPVHNCLLGGYYFHAQPEWLGGEAWTLREPHATGRRWTVKA